VKIYISPLAVVPSAVLSFCHAEFLLIKVIHFSLITLQTSSLLIIAYFSTPEMLGKNIYYITHSHVFRYLPFPYFSYLSQTFLENTPYALRFFNCCPEQMLLHCLHFCPTKRSALTQHPQGEVLADVSSLIGCHTGVFARVAGLCFHKAQDHALVT